MIFSSTFFSTLSSPPSSSYSESPNQLFITPINTAKSNLQLSTPITTVLKEIQHKLDKLSINDINQNKNQIQIITKDKPGIEQFKMSPDSMLHPLNS